MDWQVPLVRARFLRRYKRFLADFRGEDGNTITAHCPNTGSMQTCMETGAECLLTHEPKPHRKLDYTWQAIRMEDGWVGINTALANGLVAEAVEHQRLNVFTGYHVYGREPVVSSRHRLDLLLRAEGKPDCYVEVKNVTLSLAPGVMGFPDAVSRRGTAHLEMLMQLREQGHRAVLLFCVQRASARIVVPAAHIDGRYAASLALAEELGVEIRAMAARFRDQGINLEHPLPVQLNREGLPFGDIARRLSDVDHCMDSPPGVDGRFRQMVALPSSLRHAR